MKALDRVWQVLSVVLLLLAVGSCVCVASIFVNPDGVFTFLAPPTLPLPALLATPEPFRSPTPVIIFPTLPPEWTPTPRVEPSATERRSIAPEVTATETSDPNATSTSVPSPIGPTATDTEEIPPTRTATQRVVTPTRTPTPGGYPGQAPTNTQAPYP